MATLPPLKVDGYSTGFTSSLRRYSRSGGVWSEGASPTTVEVWQDLDEAITTSVADGDTGIGLLSGGNTNVVLSLTLSDTPADFQSMDTLSFRYSSVNFGGYTDDDGSFQLRVRNSSDTQQLAGHQSGGTYQFMDQFTGGVWTNTANGGSGTAPAYNKSNPFNYVNTGASKTLWDGAIITLVWSDLKSMASDGASLVIVDFELTGTYTPTAPESRPDHIWLPAGNRINSNFY